MVQSICLAAYHPVAKRQAERYVQTFKRWLKGLSSETDTLKTNLIPLFCNAEKLLCYNLRDTRVFISKTSYNYKNRFDSARCYKCCSWKLEIKKIQSNIGNLRSENTIVKQHCSLPMQSNITDLQSVDCNDPNTPVVH